MQKSRIFHILPVVLTVPLAEDGAIPNTDEVVAWLNVASKPEACEDCVMIQHVNTQEDDETPILDQMPNVDLEWITEVRRELNLLTEAETAALFGVARRTLQLWHQAGEGPARVKVGYLIAYRLDDLREWIDLHVQPSFKK